MYFFNNLSNFINLFVDVVTFVLTFEMLVWLMFVHNRPTEMIMLVFLFVLNSDVGIKVTAIIKVEYAFVVNVEILDHIFIDMVVERYLLQILCRFLFRPQSLSNALLSSLLR